MAVLSTSSFPLEWAWSSRNPFWIAFTWKRFQWPGLPTLCMRHTSWPRCWLPRPPQPGRGFTLPGLYLYKENTSLQCVTKLRSSIASCSYSNGTRQQYFPFTCFIIKMTWGFCEDRYYKGWSVPADACLKNEKQVTVIDFQLFFSLLIHFYNLNSLSSAQQRNINSLLRASWKQETSGKMHSHWHPAFPDHEKLRSQVTCSSTEFEHKLQGWMNESLNTTKIIRKMSNNMFFKALLTLSPDLPVHC